MKQRVNGCAALIAAVLCLASPAHARSERILLDFQATNGCASRAEFVELVHTFTTKAEVIEDESAARRRFGIHITRAGGVVRGELAIDDHVGKTTRTVTGTTCDEVVSALALATALAVDPDALAAEAKPSASKPEPAPPLAESAPPKPTAPELAPPKPPLAPHAPLQPPPRPKTEPRPMLDLSLGARVGDTIAPFPKFEGSVELGTTYLAPLDLHVGAAFGPVQRIHQAEFSDWLGWFGAGYRILQLEPVSVWGQTALELGQVQAVGRHITPSRRVEKLWAAVDVGLSVRLNAPGPLFFQLNASGRAPLALQRYVEQENTGKLLELHQVQQFGYLLGLSVGMHFL